jgi:hypothetical protein
MVNRFRFEMTSLVLRDFLLESLIPNMNALLKHVSIPMSVLVYGIIYYATY